MPKAVPVVSVYEVFGLCPSVSRLPIAKVSGYPGNVHRMTDWDPL